LKAASIPVCEREKGFSTWLLDGLLPCAVRAGRIIAKIFDLFAFPEIMDLIWQKVKLNTRTFTPIEKREALSVFGDGINYSKVLIDEYSIIAWLGAKIKVALAHPAASNGVCSRHRSKLRKRKQ